jgi:uncharacterized membrane protein YtjA (UPF0391 family)
MEYNHSNDDWCLRNRPNGHRCALFARHHWRRGLLINTARKQFAWGAGHPAVSSFGATARADQSKRGGQVIMFRAAISLFVIACVLAIISAILGFSGIAAGAAGAAKILFYVSIVIAVMAMVGALLFGRTSEV